MIANKAYIGKKFLYRAYFNGQVIWDYSAYTSGLATAGVDGSASPMLQTPEAVLMHAEATIEGSGVPGVWELESVQAHTEATLAGNASPNPTETVHAAGTASANIQAIGAASTFGQVFTTGRAEGTLDGQALHNVIDTVNGAGIADGDIIASLCPTVEDVLQILLSAGVTIEGSATPQMQEPEAIIGNADAELSAIGCPAALPLHTVTVMHDGRELYRTRVIHGNTCIDPVAAGIIAKPTKAMTVQYTYEFSGYSLVEGEEADATALTNITADTVVYVAFAESLRYYTVKFYDEGALVETVSVPYGSTAVTTYVKPGYKVTGYEPSNENIVADTFINLKFEEFAFASATWAEISEVAQDGTASEYFKVGDTRIETIGGNAVELVIAGFKVDRLSQYGALTGITIVTKDYYPTKTSYGPNRSPSSSNPSMYSTASIATKVNNLKSKMSTELRSVIRSASKRMWRQWISTNSYSTYTYYANFDVWLLSAGELESNTTWGSESTTGKPYPLFTQDPSLIKCSQAYYTRTMSAQTSKGFQYWKYVTTGGSISDMYFSNSYYVRFGFVV